MAQTGKNKLHRWEYPAGSGIRIREIINRFSGIDGGLSYRVTIPARLAGKRRFKQFVDQEAAEAWAKAEHEGIKKDGKKHYALSPTQRDDALAALSVLEGTGLSLAAAAAIAKRHHQPPAGSFTVPPTIAKKRRLRVLDLPKNCITWLRTVPNRTGRLAPGKYTVRWAKFVKAAGFSDWGENRSNAMRHSFGSYHYALHSDAAKTASMLGHKANDQVLFDSYRSLARKKNGEAYFAIIP